MGTMWWEGPPQPRLSSQLSLAGTAWQGLLTTAKCAHPSPIQTITTRGFKKNGGDKVPKFKSKNALASVLATVGSGESLCVPRQGNGFINH